MSRIKRIATTELVECPTCGNLEALSAIADPRTRPACTNCDRIYSSHVWRDVNIVYRSNATWWKPWTWGRVIAETVYADTGISTRYAVSRGIVIDTEVAS